MSVRTKQDTFTRETKRTPLLRLQDRDRTTKKYKIEMVWYLVGVDIMNRTLHYRLETRNFVFHVEKYSVTRPQRSPVKYLSTLDENLRTLHKDGHFVLAIYV